MDYFDNRKSRKEQLIERLKSGEQHSFFKIHKIEKNKVMLIVSKANNLLMVCHSVFNTGIRVEYKMDGRRNTGLLPIKIILYLPTDFEYRKNNGAW